MDGWKSGCWSFVGAVRIAQELVCSDNVEIFFYSYSLSILLKVEEFFLNVVLSSVFDTA